MVLLEHVLARLESEARTSGKSTLLVRLRPMLEGDELVESYKEIGESLQMSEGSVKVAAHRLPGPLPPDSSRGSRPDRRRPR